MLRSILSKQSFWIFVLRVYCFAIALYLVSDVMFPKKRSSRLMVNDKNVKLEASVLDDKQLGDPPANNLHQSGFSLSGSLRNPQPRFSLGNIPSHAKVVIGITTEKREEKSYLVKTVESLLKQLDSRAGDVKIVLYIGENDVGFVKQKAEMMLSNFTEEVEERQLQIISPPAHYYPTWSETIKSSFGDDFDRVKWRSKQNLDQIFLMMFVYNLSPEYYLIMEDNVLASKGYMEKILESYIHVLPDLWCGKESGSPPGTVLRGEDHFAENKMRRAFKKFRRLSKQFAEHLTNDWFYASYCDFGAIGKLFATRSLPSYASFLHLFWNKKPLEWLQLDFIRSSVCNMDDTEDNCLDLIKELTPRYSPSLFHHLGKVSSLKAQSRSRLLPDKSSSRRR